MIDTNWSAWVRDFPEMNAEDQPITVLMDAYDSAKRAEWRYSPMTVALARFIALWRIHVLNPLGRLLQRRGDNQ
jgi:hypothetical protein